VKATRNERAEPAEQVLRRGRLAQLPVEVHDGDRAEDEREDHRHRDGENGDAFVRLEVHVFNFHVTRERARLRPAAGATHFSRPRVVRQSPLA
jgi:hypothetical protein